MMPAMEGVMARFDAGQTFDDAKRLIMNCEMPPWSGPFCEKD